jgi:hypothetical protein
MNVLIIAAALSLSVSASRESAWPDSQEASAENAKVVAVIQRTKAVTATYAVYFWNQGRAPSLASANEWSAEFHSGSQHRVETPRNRIVADCVTGAGTYLDIVSGQVVRGPQVAAAACGINTARQIIAAKWVGHVQTALGGADRVQITDSSNIRTYDVSDDGVILTSIYALREPPQPVVLNSWASTLVHTLPNGNMFDEASLRKSFVPDRFKTAPPPQ